MARLKHTKTHSNEFFQTEANFVLTIKEVVLEVSSGQEYFHCDFPSPLPPLFPRCYCALVPQGHGALVP